ncbi:MAG: DUF4435 domain-containing protein [Muribaculum sp.]|nr:DUF4435 domain-containing protein [Muribaculum sp.]
MKPHLELPARTGLHPSEPWPDSRQITLVGGNGAGKSRFMAELIRLCGDRAYCLSALKAGFPQLDVSTAPNSIDARYRRAVMSQPYMRTDAVSEIDKLTYMLFTDEFEYLLSVKSKQISTGKKIELKPTKLDRLTKIWENLFPNNKVIRTGGRLMFSTGAGSDMISVNALSQGEKTVFYYIAGILYADPDSVIFIDSPSLFLHPSILNNLWNSLEQLRPDCIFVYDSVDEDFVATRTRNVCIWIRNYDSQAQTWDYEILPPDHVSEDLFFELIGGRKPVLFIEGDAQHSIDAKLYTLVFTDYTVRPLGSCDKVIETTRSFNDLKYMHHLSSHGIVDRDRRSDVEVDYLRRKNIFVPEVAEVENIFLLEDVIKIMARVRGRNPRSVFNKVKNAVLKMFAKRTDEQALMHVRHKVKREVECRIDAKFTCITAMETHIRSLVYQLKPRENYESILADFKRMVREQDYAGVLRVFNHKPMLGDCGVAQLLGYKGHKDYINGVISTLKGRSREADALRASLKYCFGLRTDQSYADGFEPLPRLSKKQRAALATKAHPQDADRGTDAMATYDCEDEINLVDDPK